MKRSSATRTSFPRIVMRRAQTIFCSFSISIPHRTAFLSPKLQSRRRSVCAPIQLKRISPGPIISSGVCEILTKYPDMEFAGGQTPFRAWMSILDGNYAEAERVLAASSRQDFQDIDFSFYFPKSWYQAMIARTKGDSARAMAAFRECREILAQRLIVKPEHARTIGVLAQVDAGLGQKELAVREAQHAIDLMPVSKDIYDGALVLEGLAQVYTWSGDRDRALELLQKLLTMPGYP